MNNILLYFGGFLVAVFAALFGVPYAIDWNGYRGVFEEEASRILGRDVRVSGNIGLRLLPSPYVHMEKLRIGGAIDEEAGRPLFRADDFTMWLSVPPLLKGVIEAREIELKKPVVEIAVDADGRTSLSSLQIARGSISFMPQQVALQSVRLVDGAFGLRGPGGVDLIRAEGINGELAADSLEGPFRFKGKFSWEGEERELRLTTARREANGDLRFKSVTTVLASANSYVFEGTGRGLGDIPTVTGDLSARISSRALAIAPPDAASQPESGDKLGAAPGTFDVTAKVQSEPGKIAIDDVAISMEQGGLPQLISGTSAIRWGERVGFDVNLTSKWLDLDQLTGTKGATTPAIPLELARTLFDRLVDELPAAADTNIGLSFDQLGLGGQSVSGLKIAAARAGGALELKEVRASLPGGTNLSLDGVLEGEAGVRAFTGTMALSGQSLARFSSWGFGENPFSRTRNDGPFAVEGSLLLSDAAIELTEGAAEINGTPLIGEIRLGLDAPRRIAVALDGQRINLAEIWPDNPGLSGIRGLLMSGTASAAAPSEAEGNRLAGSATGEADPASSTFFAASDVSIDIKAGELIDGARRLTNVHLDLALQKGRLSVPRLKFEGPGGLSVDMEGAAEDVPDKTRGGLRGLVEAQTPEGVSTLADLLDLPDDIDARIAHWTRFAPWRLAATLSVGERLPQAVDMSIDGVLQGGRLVANARIDGARADWRNAPMDITASIDTPDVDGFMDMLAAVRGDETQAGHAGRGGTVFVKTSGIAAEGLVAVAELEAPSTAIEFNGRMQVAESLLLAGNGDVRIDAPDLRRVLALAGLPVAPGAAGIPVKGSLAAAHDGSKLTLAAPALGIGRSSVSGVVTYVPGLEGKPAMVEADIAADQASLPGLLAVVTAADKPESEPPIVLPAEAPPPSKRRQAPASVAAEAPPLISIWPESTFDLSPLERVNGTIKASLRALTLQPGLAMKDTRLEIGLLPGRLDVRSLEGAVLGGKAVSRFALERQPAGASLNGDLKVAVSSKGSAESGSDDALDGDVASLTVAFNGKALSPHAMIGALTGKGELALGDVTLTGVSPSAVTSVSEAALLGKGPAAGAPLTEALSTSLKETSLKLGQVTIPVEISDATLKLARVQVETADGRAAFDTVLDLQTLKIDSGWKIEGKSAVRATPSVAGAEAAAGVPAPVKVERKLLPAVSVVYTGPLALLGSMQPAITADALERELTVRRMERDVDELERLRAADQLRARQERERRQALEAERQRKLEEERARREQDLLPEAVPGPEGQPADGTLLDGGMQPEVPSGAPVASDPGNLLPGSDAASAAGEVPAAAPSRQVQRAAPVKKKPAKPQWQPFQISPYQ